MAQIHQIKAHSRNDEGKGASRRLRRAGMVPAVVYGANKPAQSIQIEHNSILLAAKHEWLYSSVLDLSIDGTVQKVLVRDWQKHPYKQLMLHMDFLRVDEHALVRVHVPLHFLNQEKSPAGKAAGVVISHNLNDVEVACLPKDLPEFIEVDLSDLKPGEILHLSQLKLAVGVSIPALSLGADHDIAVVTTTEVKEEVEAPIEGAAVPTEAPKK